MGRPQSSKGEMWRMTDACDGDKHFLQLFWWSVTLAYIKSASEGQQWAQSLQLTHRCWVNSLWLSKTCLLLLQIQRHAAQSRALQYSLVLFLLLSTCFLFNSPTAFYCVTKKKPFLFVFEGDLMALGCDNVLVSKDLTGDWHVRKQAWTQWGSLLLFLSLSLSLTHPRTHRLHKALCNVPLVCLLQHCRCCSCRREDDLSLLVQECVLVKAWIPKHAIERSK